MACQDDYKLSREELQELIDISGMDFKFSDDGQTASQVRVAPDPQALMQRAVRTLFAEGGTAFAYWATDHYTDFVACSDSHPEVIDTLVLCYRLGIAAGNGDCACNLGALYYMGQLLEQDYGKAAELYELADELGCNQGLVNLGYIYEYGRIGDPDYQKAYECYALAAAGEEDAEALYKLGDMYSRGQAVEQNKLKAYRLWQRSLDVAQDPTLRAQPSIRIAQLLMSPECEELGIKSDYLLALSLFQDAEVGLRIDITENGMTYYEKRLTEAIEGQAKAREMLEREEDGLSADA